MTRTKFIMLLHKNFNKNKNFLLKIKLRNFRYLIHLLQNVLAIKLISLLAHLIFNDVQCVPILPHHGH